MGSVPCMRGSHGLPLGGLWKLLCGSWATIVPSQKGDICPGFPRLWSTPLASVLSQQLLAFVTDKRDQEKHSRHVKPRDQCPPARSPWSVSASETAEPSSSLSLIHNIETSAGSSDCTDKRKCFMSTQFIFLSLYYLFIIIIYNWISFRLKDAPYKW